jgi:glycosyltransferase involved in cell wall biosynthesis
MGGTTLWSGLSFREGGWTYAVDSTCCFPLTDVRIALISETFLPTVDGVVTRLTRTVEYLGGDGYEVLVVAPEGGLREYAGARVHGLRSPALPYYTDQHLVLPRPSLFRALDQFGPDLVHVVAPVVIGAAGVAYARARRLPLVASYHTHFPRYVHYFGAGWLEPRVWRAVRLIHGYADVNLCTSQAMLVELRAAGVPRLAVWRRAVDTQRFHPRTASLAMRSRLTGGEPHRPLLLSVGRLAPEKNLEALVPVLASLPEVHLAIVGDGPHRPQLERDFRGTRTSFHGYLHGDELASAFASSDLFVLPSRTETLGLVVLEAMASACVVVCARAGGVPELVDHGVTGYLFSPDRSDALIACVRRALDDAGSSVRPSMGERARGEAERWSWPAATRQLEGFYEEARQSEVHRARIGKLTATRDLAMATGLLLQVLACLFVAQARLETGRQWAAMRERGGKSRSWRDACES